MVIRPDHGAAASSASNDTQARSDQGRRAAVALTMLMAGLSALLALRWLADATGDHLIALMLAGMIVVAVAPVACTLFGCSRRARNRLPAR